MHVSYEWGHSAAAMRIGWASCLKSRDNNLGLTSGSRLLRRHVNKLARLGPKIYIMNCLVIHPSFIIPVYSLSENSSEIYTVGAFRANPTSCTTT